MSKKEENVAKTKYTIEQILKSKKYSNVDKDIIKALCTDGEYCLEEVEAIISKFKNRKVE